MISFVLVSVFVIYGSYPITIIPALIPQPFCEKTDVGHIFPPEKIKFSSFNHTVTRGPKRVKGDPDVQAGPSKKSQSTRMTREFKSEDVAAVPTLRVRLSQSVHLPPRQSTFVSIQVENHSPEMESMLLENDPKVEEITGVQVDDALLMPTKQGFAQLLVSNRSGFTQSIEEGVILGEAVEATVISPGDVPPQECGSEASVAGVRDTLEEYTNSGLVRRVMSVEEEQARRKKPLE